MPGGVAGAQLNLAAPYADFCLHDAERGALLARTYAGGSGACAQSDAPEGLMLKAMIVFNSKSY